MVSVLRWPLEREHIKPYTHLQIEVDDDEDENLLESFPVCIRFIKDALEADGAVFVHWYGHLLAPHKYTSTDLLFSAMGKSRSATIVIAYMISQLHQTPSEALAQLRTSRAGVEPNPGFMHQLELFHSMQAPSDVDSHPIYQRWLYQRELDAARAAGIAPDADKIRFGDEHVDEEGMASQIVTDQDTQLSAIADLTTITPTNAASTKPLLDFKCRKCRRTLASSSFLIPHTPSPSPRPSTSPSCSHLFLEPLSWMREQLEQGLLEGRLECPNARCKANVGKYAWQGLRCSCGEWVVPAISLARARVDESVVRGKGTAGGTGSGDGAGIRRPPGMGGGGNGNL